MEKKCGNCLLYNHKNGECKVAILIEGEEYHMPVFPSDHCHMEELGIPIEQVRWYEDRHGVKIEYPEGFFGEASSKHFS